MFRYLQAGLTFVFSIGLATSSYADDYPLKPLSEMGVQTKTSKSGTDTIQEFFDSKTKNNLVYQYNAQNVLESIEVRNALGATVEKTRFLPKRLWKQIGTELNEWYTDPTGRNIHRITDLTGRKKPILLPYEPDVHLEQCDVPLTQDVNKVEDLVKDLEPQMFNHLGKAKIKTSDCSGYTGGSKQLMKEMQEAINTGAECLAGTSPESKKEATMLLAYFENKKTTVNIFCTESDKDVKISKHKKDKVGSTTLARALVPPTEKSPGMIINLSDIKSTTAEERKSTLFHEMLHWLGILHSESFDTPYLADSCCFSPDKTIPKAQKACDLLKKTPRPDLHSKEYLNSFTEVMLLDYRSFIPMNLVRKSTSKVMLNPPIDLSGQFEATQKIRAYGNVTSDVHAHVLKKLDSNLKESEDYKKDESAYGQAAELTGDLVALMYQQNTSYEDFEKSASQTKAKYKELIANAKDEDEKKKIRDSIKTWLDEYGMLPFKVTSPTDSTKDYPYKIWEDLAKDL